MDFCKLKALQLKRLRKEDVLVLLCKLFRGSSLALPAKDYPTANSTQSVCKYSFSSQNNKRAQNLEPLAREAIIIGTIITSYIIIGRYSTTVLDEGSVLSKIAKNRKCIYLCILY